MKRMVLLVISLLLLFDASAGWAQRRAGTGRAGSHYGLAHKFEVIPYGGYLWSVSRGFIYNGQSGDVDFSSGGIWGVALDVNLRPGAQLELMYQRQSTDLNFTSGFPSFKEKIADYAIEYYQIGGLGGLQQGELFSYSKVTLGATRFAPDAVGFSDTWRFSVILGLGAKLYVSERVALRLEGDLPFTFFSGGVGIGIGGGGIGTYVGGSGLTQFQLQLGVAILLGSD